MAVADTIMAIRSSVDYVARLLKVSQFTLQYSNALEQSPDWIKRGANTAYDARTQIPASVVAAFTFRVQAALCGLEVANHCVTAAEYAMPQLYVDYSVTRTANAAIAGFFPARVHQCVKTVDMTAYLDAAVGNYSPNSEALRYLKEGNWSAGFRLGDIPDVHLLSSIEASAEIELYYMACLKLGFTPHTFAMRDHPQFNDAPVEFADKAEDDFVRAAYRYSPGYAVVVCDLHTGAAGARVTTNPCDINAVPAELQTWMVNTVPITAYKVEGTTYTITPPQKVPLVTKAPTVNASLLIDEVAKTAPLIPPAPTAFEIQKAGNTGVEDSAGNGPAKSAAPVIMVTPLPIPPNVSASNTQKPILRNSVMQASAILAAAHNRAEADTKKAKAKSVNFNSLVAPPVAHTVLNAAE
jgi:hypothetical protein